MSRLKMLAGSAAAVAAGLAITMASPASASTTAPQIYPGQTGEGVKCAQRAINWHFGTSIAVDGSYGPITQYYIKKIQGAAPASTQNAIIGPITGDRLMGSLNNAGWGTHCYPYLRTSY